MWKISLWTKCSITCKIWAENLCTYCLVTLITWQLFCSFQIIMLFFCGNMFIIKSTQVNRHFHEFFAVISNEDSWQNINVMSGCLPPPPHTSQISPFYLKLIIKAKMGIFSFDLMAGIPNFKLTTKNWEGKMLSIIVF